MITHDAYRIDHPAGTFMAVLAWNPENYTDAISILRDRFGSLASITGLLESEVRDWSSVYGFPIMLVTAE